MKFIGTMEGLAAIGLILPAATHARRKEPQAIAINSVLLIVAVVIAWGRFGPCSF